MSERVSSKGIFGEDFDLEDIGQIGKNNAIRKLIFNEDQVK